MADIKTTSEEARDQALAALYEAATSAKHQIDAAVQKAEAELATRASAIAQVSGLVERCKHVLVKDITLQHDVVALSELRLRVGNHNDVQFVPYEGDRRLAPHLRTYEDGPRTYRIWLCIEELPK